MKSGLYRTARFFGKVSQEELARRMKKSQSFIARVEAGKRILSTEEERSLVIALGLSERKE